jgi:5-methylcytosine-specific restriction endonuclease McrA
MPYKDLNRRKECGARYYRNNAESIKKATKRWKKEHPEETLKHAADYLKRNPEVHKKWLKEHPEHVRAYNSKRRAAKTKAGGHFTPEEFLGLCRKYKHKCLCCRKRKRLTADHVVPVSRGGSSNISNIQPLCGPCNNKKRTRTTDYRTIVKVSSL